MTTPLPPEFWVLRSTPHPSYFIVQSVLPPVQQNAVVVAGPFQTQAEAQTWIDDHSGPNPKPKPKPSTGSWWVLAPSVVSRGQPPFVAVESVTRPKDTAVSHVVAGPFATKAEAEAWITKQTAIPSIPNPLSFLGWLQGVQHWIGILVAAITDIHTWISLGWGALGLILLVSGVILWVMKYTDIGNVAELGAATVVRSGV